MTNANRIFTLIMLFFLFSFVHAQNSQKLDTVKFSDLSGEKISLNLFKGKITIVNFWATWCAACLKEMPELQKIYEEFDREQVRVVGIAVMSDKNKIKKMIDLTRVTYTILIGTRKDLQKFSKDFTIPQTIILNSKGEVIARFTGDQDYKTFYQSIITHLDHAELSDTNQSFHSYANE